MPKELEADIYEFEIFNKAMEKLCSPKSREHPEEILIEERLLLT
jgi:hypothetical protein